MRRLVFLSALVLASAPAHADQPRFLLAAGSNEGGPSRQRLWFAEHDAERFAKALEELGGFERGEVKILKGPSADELKGALAALAADAKSALQKGEIPLVVFYYSGHADLYGLELGKERLAYGDLAKLLSDIPEGVRIAILDACHAGALTQVKGARPAPLDFEVPQEPRADGVAIITSSSASEAAQESAALGGSFFTHHMTLGLRGAADSNGDGRVTLLESYRYAYHRTLAATAEAGVAPQHPTYSIKMAGKGEVVLVDLRRARSTLAFPAGSGRSYLVTHEKSMEVVAEVASAGEALRVALPAGRYRIERILPSPRLTGVVDLPLDGGVAVDDGSLTPVVAVAAMSKGDQADGARRTFAGAEIWVASPVLRNFGPNYGAGLSLRHDLPSVSLMGSFSYSERGVDDDGVPYRYRAGTLSVGAGWRLEFRRLSFLLGAQAGLALAQQTLADGSNAGGVILHAGPLAGVVVPLLDWLALRVTWAGFVHSFRLNGEQVTRASVQMATGLDFGL